MSEPRPGALSGLRVLDASILFAGPLAATLLGDFGADVIKVEHPRGDPARTHGPAKDGIGLWWKMLSRNKRAITCDLGTAEGAQLFRRLAASADVVVENFRPGTFERWGLDYPTLTAENPALVMARVTGFGQYGPYAGRPAFGTLAEAMSGFAAMTGEPGGPPTLPPFGLADGIAGIATAFAVMTALHARRETGRGQVIDLAIIEPILTVLGSQPTVYDQLGLIPERLGNRSSNNAPRNAYQTKDSKWVAISTSAQPVAERVMRLVGYPEVIAEPWFSSGSGRAAHSNELDSHVARWIAERPLHEVLNEFSAASAAVAPIYDISDIMSDPQLITRAITSVRDSDFGTIRMQNVLFELSQTPGAIRHTGPRLGEHNHEIYSELGLSETELERLRSSRVI